MRRYNFISTLFMALFVSAAYAHAGVGDWFTGIALGKVLGIVITGLFTLASVFGLGVAKYKRAALEGKNFRLWIVKSTRKDSPGGASITGDELDDGLEKFGKLGIALLEAAGKMPVKK